MRVDKSGIPYVVEINANPCLSPDSGVVAAVEQAGWILARRLIVSLMI